MSQVTEQSVRFQTALASIKLIQASAVLDLTEDDFDFLTSNKVWIATDRSRARRCVEACVYGTLDFVGYPRFPAPVEFIAAVIAYYVHPVNIQTACLIMEGAEFTENIINGVERPVKAARSEERFSRNAETDLVCRLLLEKKRADFGLAYSGGKLFAIGGDTTGGGYFDSTNLVDELDVSGWPSGSWVASPPLLPTPNRHANQADSFPTRRSSDLVNIQTACLIMEGAEFTENIINGVERPVKAAELFAFTLRVRAGNTDVLTDAEENVRQKLRAEGVM